MPRLCIFCRKPPVKRSVEHILPQWMWPVLGLGSGTGITNVHKRRVSCGESQLTYVVIKNFPTTSANGFVEGRMCKKCNTGWMSRVENKVKPILSPLTERPTSIEHLSKSDREILSLWAVKTALVLVRSRVIARNVPEDHYDEVFNGRIPRGIGVFAGFHLHNQGFSWTVDRNWSAHYPREQEQNVLNTLHEKSYKVCLQLGALLLLVAYAPPPHLFLGGVTGLHQQLWSERPIFERPEQVQFIGLSSDDSRRLFGDLLHIVWMPEPFA
jgi:hypothetical protein